jgi:cyclomaltodextrinase / maltogenic alpha-amylase / neopullulanase
MKINIKLLLLILMISSTTSCHQQIGQVSADEGEYRITTPDWIKDKNIYEVNIRQYTPEGTFEAFEKDIPRLKAMGVDILWLMPIHEIGEKNRKGSLGSNFSIKDYKSINPHFGTKEDFSRLVKTVHEHDMYILIDWVANHTAWDHEWTLTHPEYYSKNDQGEFMPPHGTDWEDVINLDYDNKEVHEAMADAMLYWVKDFDIDGFRCDAAERVPMSFWKRVRKDLDQVKPVFLLADGTDPALFEAMDMTYSSDMSHMMASLFHGHNSAVSLDSIIQTENNIFPKKANRMRYLTNHDLNTWVGTLDSLMGPAHKAMAVLTYTAPGMPMVYSGQESNTAQRLEFFEKDTIQWGNYENAAFYSSLNTLKRQNEAIWNGNFGGEYTLLEVSDSADVFAYKRSKNNNTVITILNLSDKRQQYHHTEAMKGTIRYFGDDKEVNDNQTADELEPWGYRVYIK